MRRAARGRGVLGESHDVDTRMGVVETKIDQMELSIHHVVKAIDGIKEFLAAGPRHIPFKEIIVAISITLGVVVMLGQQLASWHTLANQNLQYRIDLLEKNFHKQLLK